MISVESIISEKNYPVQFLWVLKSIIGSVISLIIFGALWLLGARTPGIATYLVLIALFTPLHFVITILRRANFRYAVEEKFLTLYQGILSKQQRHIPYGVVQNIFVKQDLFDRLFGLASITIENASQGAGVMQGGEAKIFGGMTVRAQQERRDELVGFSGNKVNIPGLMKADAEILKDVILNKMKENQAEDSQSGL